MAKLKKGETAMLEYLAKRPVEVAECSEAERQSLISLGMREPPMVEVGGASCFITQAGRDALASS